MPAAARIRRETHVTVTDQTDVLEARTDRAVEVPREGLRHVALRGGLWSAASQLLPAVGTAVLSVAAGRYLGSGPLGQQSLIAYVNAALAAVLVLALNNALLQVGGRLQGQGDTSTLRQLIRWAVGAHLAAGLVVLATMITIGGVVGENRVSWMIIGVVSVLDAVADAFAIRLVLSEGWAPIGRLRLVFQLIGPVLGLVFLFAGYGIAGLFFGDGLAALGLLVVVAVRFRRLGRTVFGAGTGQVDARVTLEPPVPVWRSYSLFALGAVITQVVTKRVEFVVLAVFATSSAIGQYSVAFMAVSLIAMIPLGVASAAMPLVARAGGSGDVERAVRHLRFALRIGTAVSIPVVALLAAVGPAAVVAVYGTSYETAARLVPVASLGLLVAVIVGICAQYWTGHGRLAIVLSTGAVAGVADIAVACATVPFLSSLGAVLANLTGQVVLAVGLLYATVRHSGAIGWRADGLLRMTVAGGLGATAAALVRLAVDHLSIGPEPRAVIALVTGGVLGLAVVVAAAFALRPFDGGEADWLRSLLPRRMHAVTGRLSAAS